ITGEASYGTSLLANGIFHQAPNGLHQRERRLFSGPLGEGRKADHVCEKHGDLPALGVQAILPWPAFLRKTQVAASFCISLALSTIPDQRSGQSLRVLVRKSRRRAALTISIY